jgi:hypothetical protein
MKIPIETGRWENIPKEKRLCKFCNDGNGDELLFIHSITDNGDHHRVT